MRYPFSRLVCLFFILASLQVVVAKDQTLGWGSEWKSSANRSDGALLVDAVNHLVQQKRYDKALELIEHSLQENPGHPGLEILRGGVFSAKGEQRKAIAIYAALLQRKELSKESQAAILTGRGFAFYRAKEYRNSLEDQVQALSIAPTALRHNNLAWILATCPDASLRDGKKAVKEASIAVREVSGEMEKAACLDTLAAAYAEVGDFPSAIRWQAKSLELASSPAIRQAGEQHLKLYKNNQPFRQNPDDF